MALRPGFRTLCCLSHAMPFQSAINEQLALTAFFCDFAPFATHQRNCLPCLFELMEPLYLTGGSHLLYADRPPAWRLFLGWCCRSSFSAFPSPSQSVTFDVLAGLGSWVFMVQRFSNLGPGEIQTDTQLGGLVVYLFWSGRQISGLPFCLVSNWQKTFETSFES